MHKWIYLYLAISFFTADMFYNMDLNYIKTKNSWNGYIADSIMGIMWPVTIPMITVLTTTKIQDRWDLGKHDIDISPIIDTAIEFNLELQNINSVETRCMPECQFSRYFQTVSINLGRTAGHTTYISKHFKEDDLVIFYSPAPQEYCEMNIYKGRSKNFITFHNIKKYNTKFYNIIWIDSKSMFNEYDINDIYENFSGKCKKFVMLG